MASYEATIPAAWPADEMFRYLATFSNAEQWDPGVLSGKALDAGPLRVGSRFRLVVPFAGRRLPLIYRITGYSERDLTVSLEATSMLLRARDVITVLAASVHGQATEVRYRAEVTLRGPLRLLDPLLTPGFSKVGDRAAAALRVVLSAAPAPEISGTKKPS
jgi:Polyketide cyclase / dehydrase and lipid transport